MYDIKLVQMRSLLLLPSWLGISYVYVRQSRTRLQHSIACLIRSQIPESNHITSDCSLCLCLCRSPKRPFTVLTACKFMSLLKKTLNECHAFFYPATRCDCCPCGPQQLIRHVKELVQLIVAVPVRGLWTVLGIKMVTPEPDRGEQQTHLKMLKLINCAANADQEEARRRSREGAGSRGQRCFGNDQAQSQWLDFCSTIGGQRGSTPALPCPTLPFPDLWLRAFRFH